MHGKVRPLSEWLARAVGETVTLGFAEIDKLVEGLPRSARHYRAWWANQTGSGHPEAQAWMEAAWSVDHVDFDSERVTFRRG